MAASGHIRLVQRKRGPVWYVKYRLPNGREVRRKLGPAWTKRSQPPPRHLTEGDARAALARLLEAAEREPQQATKRTFQNAADEWLRYVEHEKRIAPTTLRRYRSGLHRRVMPFFGGATRRSRR